MVAHHIHSHPNVIAAMPVLAAGASTRSRIPGGSECSEVQVRGSGKIVPWVATALAPVVWEVPAALVFVVQT